MLRTIFLALALVSVSFCTGCAAPPAAAPKPSCLAPDRAAVGTQLNEGKFAAIRKSTEPGTVLFARIKGTQNIGKTIAKLREYAARKGYSLAGYPVCIFEMDFPSAPETSVIEVQCPIAEVLPDQYGDVSVKWHPALEVLSTFHLGPYESVGQTYGFLMGVVGQRQLCVPQRAREIYYTDPANTPPAKNLTEVQIILQ